MPANLENSAVATGWQRSVFISIPKKGNAKECSNYSTIALISHASKVMLKILQAGLQQYMNQEFPDVQAGFKKSRGIREQIANIFWIIEKQSNSRKHLFLLRWLCWSLWLCRSINPWKILRELGIPDHLTFLLRNLYAGQEATVRPRRGTMDCFKIGKGICQGCILSPCLFNLKTVYIMRNAWLDEAQAAMRISGRNINNLRYADDTTPLGENKEEL